jgi:hypothetical protein
MSDQGEIRSAMVVPAIITLLVCAAILTSVVVIPIIGQSLRVEDARQDAVIEYCGERYRKHIVTLPDQTKEITLQHYVCDRNRCVWVSYAEKVSEAVANERCQLFSE